MGQTPSKSQGTLTIGYIATTNVKTSATPVRIDVDPTTRDQYCSLVSERPELYALKGCMRNEALCEDNAISYNGRRQEQLGRVDSGYNEDDDNDRRKLKNDLDYIDETYYRSYRHTTLASTPTLAVQQQNHQTLIEDRPFTLIDACAGELNSRSMQEIDASARRLVYLSPNICYLKTIQRLDLSHNSLSQLPDAIGSLENLEFLCLSHNQLIELPESISNISNLVELDISYNRLYDLTPCFRTISKKLQTIHAENNFIASISFHVRNMARLTTLNLSDNPIRVLPAEIAQLPHLRRLVTRGCPLITEMTHPLKHYPPSLREICARIVVDANVRSSRQPRRFRQQQFNISLLPSHLVTYLQSAKPCSFCHGPYLEHYVTRGQWIEKPDGIIPLEHRLCTAHWQDDNDRILHMFSANQPLLPVASSNKKERRSKRDDSTLDAGAAAGAAGAAAATAAEEESGGNGGGSIVTASTAATNGSTPTLPSFTEPGSATATADRWRLAQRKVNTHRWLTTKLKRPPL